MELFRSVFVIQLQSLLDIKSTAPEESILAEYDLQPTTDDKTDLFRYALFLQVEWCFGSQMLELRVDWWSIFSQQCRKCH